MKKNKLKLVEQWLLKFPCKDYFGTSTCIIEFIDPKDIKKDIDEAYSIYKRTDEVEDWVKNHIS